MLYPYRVTGIAGVLAWALFMSSAALAQLPPKLDLSSPAVLARPHDVVLHPEGRWLYVADMNNDSVAVLDPDTLDLVGRIGVGELAKPHDVAFDQSGRLLVADTANSRIAIYEISGARGRLVAQLTKGLNWTEGVATAPDGDLYATNVGDSDVVRFRADELAQKNGSSGTAPGQLVRPHDIDVTTDGRVFIADPGNHRIQIWSADLQPLGELRHAFNEPKYFDLADHGWLYVADQHNHVIKVFNAALEPVTQFGEGILNLPEGVEVAGERIWVSDTYNDRVRLFRWDARP